MLLSFQNNPSQQSKQNHQRQNGMSDEMLFVMMHVASK